MASASIKRPITVPSDSPWMRPAEAAAYSKLSEARIRELINSGALPVANFTQRKSSKGREDVLIERCDLDNVIRLHKERKGADGAAAEQAGKRPKRIKAGSLPGANAFLASLKDDKD